MKSVLAALICVLLTACAHSDASLRLTGSASDLGPRLNNWGAATLTPNALVVLQGDGVVLRRSSDGIFATSTGKKLESRGESLGDLFASVVPKSLSVVIRANDKDTVSQSEERWRTRSYGDLAILSFGIGDAAAKTPPATFRSDLKAAIRARRAVGCAVFLIVPPVLADKPANGALEIYRALIREVGPSEGAAVFEAPGPDSGNRPGGYAIASPVSFGSLATEIASHILLARPSKAT